jgi:hypothetical protein
MRPTRRVDQSRIIPTVSHRPFRSAEPTIREGMTLPTGHWPVHRRRSRMVNRLPRWMSFVLMAVTAIVVVSLVWVGTTAIYRHSDSNGCLRAMERAHLDGSSCLRK